jgi:hypothetical protein
MLEVRILATRWDVVERGRESDFLKRAIDALAEKELKPI